MGFTRKHRLATCLAIVPVAAAIWVLLTGFRSGPTAHADQAASSIRTIHLGSALANAAYAVTVTVKDPAQLQGLDAIHVVLSDSQGEVESKWLHSADLDFYLTLRPRSSGPLTVKLTAAAGVRIPEITATLSRIPEAIKPAQAPRGVIAAAPNDTWQSAQPFELGQTIFGSDDERPYAPSKSEDALRGHGERLPVVSLHIS